MLTAVEDFVAAHQDLGMAVVPGFCGFGVVWPGGAEYANAVAALLAPYDGHPLRAALKANRLHHFADAYRRRVEIRELKARLARQESTLRGLLDAEESEISRQDVRRALDDLAARTDGPVSVSPSPGA